MAVRAHPEVGGKMEAERLLREEMKRQEDAAKKEAENRRRAEEALRSNRWQEPQTRNRGVTPRFIQLRIKRCRAP